MAASRMGALLFIFQGLAPFLPQLDGAAVFVLHLDV